MFLLLLPFINGCNLFSGMDRSTQTVNLVEQARYLADNGDCVTARDLLVNVSPRTDEVAYVLGFARLCIAGATVANIGTTVAGYTTSSGSDYTVIGQLARKLLPWSASKETEISGAIEAFHQITDVNRRAYTLVVGRLSHLAIILTRAVASRSSLAKDDISPAASCTSLVACPAGGMSDSDALEFRTEVSTLATEVSAISLTGLSDLSTALSNSFVALAGADAVRYTVRTQVIPQ